MKRIGNKVKDIKEKYLTTSIAEDMGSQKGRAIGETENTKIGDVIFGIEEALEKRYGIEMVGETRVGSRIVWKIMEVMEG